MRPTERPRQNTGAQSFGGRRPPLPREGEDKPLGRMAKSSQGQWLDGLCGNIKGR